MLNLSKERGQERPYYQVAEGIPVTPNEWESTAGTANTIRGRGFHATLIRALSGPDSPGKPKQKA
jgi:hypothetical protein